MAEQKRALLTLESEIFSHDDGFTIEIKNSETGKSRVVNSVRDYAEYIIESVNSSLCDDFTIVWKKSPKANRRDIDLIGMQLGMMQEWMEKELKMGQEEFTEEK